MNERSTNQHPHRILPTGPSSRIGRLLLGAGLVLLLLLLTWSAGRAGFSSLVSTYAAKSYETGAAKVAIDLTPNSPDAHFALGGIFEARNEPAAAAVEYDAAATSRPDDCILWLSLARVRELSGDTDGATSAARRAVPLAPYYAQPHWQLGNILLRAGQQDEGFRELRLAALSNPTLMPTVIDLAWRLSGGNPQFIQQAIRPETPEAYKMLGQYLRHFGDLNAALYIYKSSAGRAPEQERRANIAGLIKANRFTEAYDLWFAAHPQGKTGILSDPGFEQEGDLQEPGFGWSTAQQVQGFQLSLDATSPRQGRSSLKVDFEGNSDPAAPVISQLVLVEPRTRYQLRFEARTENIVTGGLPRLVATDGTTKGLLGQSAELPQASNGWHEYSFEFESGDSSTAVLISLQRQPCAGPACPIFGRLWLDNVSLQKM
jgi:tetratricopeptide (TPR) repeat protein